MSEVRGTGRPLDRRLGRTPTQRRRASVTSPKRRPRRLNSQPLSGAAAVHGTRTPRTRKDPSGPARGELAPKGHRFICIIASLMITLATIIGSERWRQGVAYPCDRCRRYENAPDTAGRGVGGGVSYAGFGESLFLRVHSCVAARALSASKTGVTGRGDCRCGLCGGTVGAPDGGFRGGARDPHPHRRLRGQTPKRKLPGSIAWDHFQLDVSLLRT